MTLYCFLISKCINFKGEKEKRKYFLLQQNILSVKTENDGILSILVPKFIQNKLKANQSNIAINQKNVAIIFADISNFDDIIEAENLNIVHLLDTLYRSFDTLCYKYGAQKIETVGKTYMAATGIKECEFNLSK